MRIARLAAFVLLALASPLAAQHLWWDTGAKELSEATVLYGEITVLATHPTTYYCGANWHPGEPAGGYCGIQHNRKTEKRTIFSIWDTAPTLHPKVTEAEEKTVHNRFGGEGEGGHTHQLYEWDLGETFRFVVRKQPGSEPNTTDARYYFFDRVSAKWHHAATIQSPNGDQKSARSVSLLGGAGIVSFLENFSGRDKDAPKLALYRLWLGNDVKTLTPLTRADGDGKWGRIGDAYYLAEGDDAALAKIIADSEAKWGKATIATKDVKPEPLPETPLPDETRQALEALPQAPAVAAEVKK